MIFPKHMPNAPIVGESLSDFEWRSSIVDSIKEHTFISREHNYIIHKLITPSLEAYPCFVQVAVKWHS